MQTVVQFVSKTRPMSMPVPRKHETNCGNCNLRELCLSQGLDGDDLARVENLVYARRRVKRGEALFGSGDAFSSIYAIRSGFFKTTLLDGEGREQVTGFHMAGELLGLDGIGMGRHHGNAVALEDAEVCVLPFSLIEQIGRDVPSLQRNLQAVLSREIVRERGVMMLLGSMRAEARLASFLLNLSRRFQRRGFSPCEFHLRMTREEIGSFLGLKLETVSRLFSKFQEDGVIEVRQKHVRIADAGRLERSLASVH